MLNAIPGAKDFDLLLTANSIARHTVRANRCDVAAVTRALKNMRLDGMRRAYQAALPGAKLPTSREAFIAYICAREVAYV